MLKNCLVIGADYHFGRELAISLMYDNNVFGVGFNEIAQAPFPYSTCFNTFELGNIICDLDITKVFLILYMDIDREEQFVKEAVLKAADRTDAEVITVYTQSAYCENK